MKILALGTSGKNCTIAISEDKKVIKELNINTGLTHSETLLPNIDSIFKETNLSLSDIDAYAVSVGPGSFTGIRIGIATIKGICLGANKPVLAVPSLLALAYNVKDFNGYIVSCIDAKNDNVYAKIYNSSNGQINDITCDSQVKIENDYIVDNVASLIHNISLLDKNIMIVGDGVNLLKEKSITNNNGYSIEFAENNLCLEYASSISSCAFDLYTKGEVTDGVHLSPLYLKKSQAERELENN